jgi:hypothetical protein
MRASIALGLNAFRIGLAEFWKGYTKDPSGC